jgi:hypothetical protein
MFVLIIVLGLAALIASIALVVAAGKPRRLHR